MLLLVSVIGPGTMIRWRGGLFHATPSALEADNLYNYTGSNPINRADPSV